MKEATGELNITIIVIMAIAILIAFFYYVIWPGLDGNFKANSKCGAAWCDNPCTTGDNSCSNMVGKLAKCHYEDNGRTYDIECPWKG